MNNDFDSISSFVVTLAKALLKADRREWLDMEEVAEFCRSRKIELAGERVDSERLEKQLRPLFSQNQEFCAPEVTVDGYERRVGWDLKFLIRAYPFTPRQYAAKMAKKTGIANIGYTVPILPPLNLPVSIPRIPTPYDIQSA